MSVDWNPSAQATLGLERAWPSAKSFALDAATKVLGMSLDQSASQVIGTIRVPVASIPVRGGRYALEVYDGETAVGATPAATATLTARPNEDVDGVGTSSWTGTASDTTDIYEHIDETPPASGGYIYSRASQVTYYGRMDTGSLSLTGKQIVAVRLCAYIGGYTGRNSQAVLGLNIGGTDYLSGVFAGLLHGSGIQSSYLKTYEWLVNPSTGAPWSIADVQSFDTSNEWLVKALNSGRVFVSNAYMEIDVSDGSDDRLAVGVLDDSASGLTAGDWNLVTMLTPTGGAWTKDGSGRHLYLLRRTSTVGSLVVPLLDGAAVDFASGWRPTVDAASLLITSMSDARTELFGLIQRTSAPADSVDSIPYAAHVTATVYSGQDAEQEFSDAAATTYGHVRFYAKPGDATADLLVKVRRRSDDVQLGSTITWTAAQVAALPDAGGGWKLCAETMSSSATLAGSTQYYLEFSSTAVEAAAWSVLAYDTWDQGNGTGFGGTTDRATINGAEASRYDIPCTFSQVPDPLDDGTTSIAALALTDGEGVAVAEIEYVRCEWTATANGATFDYYEIQRSEDAGTTWVTVARIYDEATEYFDDIEGLRAVQATYRARVMLTSGAPSAWVTLGSETPAASTGTLYFTSNWSLDASLAFRVDDAGSPAWAQLDTSTVHAPYGLDGHLAFRGSERRYRRFSATLWPVVQLSSSGRAGVGVFDPLDDLVVSPVPYIAVLDHRGDRWFADVTVGGETEPAMGDYQQTIEVLELTRIPVPVQLTAVPA